MLLCRTVRGRDGQSLQQPWVQPCSGQAWIACSLYMCAALQGSTSQAACHLQCKARHERGVLSGSSAGRLSLDCCTRYLNAVDAMQVGLQHTAEAAMAGLMTLAAMLGPCLPASAVLSSPNAGIARWTPPAPRAYLAGCHSLNQSASIRAPRALPSHMPCSAGLLMPPCDGPSHPQTRMSGRSSAAWKTSASSCGSLRGSPGSR